MSSDLHTVLATLRPRDEGERGAVRRMAELAAAGDPYDRSTPLHVTASAVVVHPPTRRVLLRWHLRQKAWMQVGGHVDPGETDPAEVALREGVEETGLTDLTFWPGEDPQLVHALVIPVKAGKGEPAHEHADLRFVLATDHPDAIVPEEEGAELRWLSLAEATGLTSEENLRETLRRVGELWV